MLYISGLSILEETNIRVADIDSKNIRIFVRNEIVKEKDIQYYIRLA